MVSECFSSDQKKCVWAHELGDKSHAYVNAYIPIDMHFRCIRADIDRRMDRQTHGHRDREAGERAGRQTGPKKCIQVIAHIHIYSIEQHVMDR